MGRYTDNSSARINAYRYLSRSAQNLNTDAAADSNGDGSFQSLPFKRNYIKNTIKSKNIGLHSNKNDSEVTIAIDIGTTFSGFSFAVEGAPSNSINIMNSVKGNYLQCFIKLFYIHQTSTFRSKYEKITINFIAQLANRISFLWI